MQWNISKEFYSFLKKHNPFHNKKLIFGDDFSINGEEYEIVGVGESVNISWDGLSTNSKIFYIIIYKFIKG